MARRVKGAIAAAPEIVAQARNLLAHGLSKRAIALRLGVSEATLYRSLRSEEGGTVRADADIPHGMREDPGDAGSGPDAAAHDSTRGDPRESLAAPASDPASEVRNRVAERQKDEANSAYPEALLRRVPRDFMPILPLRHYLALLRAAERAGSAAAAESVRQALLLHAEPMIPPPTDIELVLSPAEEAELNVRTLERSNIPTFQRFAGGEAMQEKFFEPTTPTAGAIPLDRSFTIG
jgi:hypothetical protein